MRSKYWIQASIVVSYITCFLFKMYNMIFRLVVFKVWKLIASASLENLCVCFFLNVNHLLKTLLHCYNITSVLWFCFVWFVFLNHMVCEISAPQPQIKPIPPAWEKEVLTTGPPGKSLGTCTKHRFLGSTQNLLYQKLWVWDQQSLNPPPHIYILKP